MTNLRRCLLGVAVGLCGCTGNLVDPGGEVPELGGPEVGPEEREGTEPGAPETPDSTRPVPAICDSFMPSAPEVYGAKVKDLLTGLALTDAELQTLTADPAALPGLIDAWLEREEADAKLLTFFRTAFQQEGFEEADFANQIGENNVNFGNIAGTRQRTDDVLMQNVRDSFARTMLALVKEGAPFSELATTRRFQMTTAMMVYLAYADERLTDDNGRRRVRSMNDVIPSLTFQNEMAYPAEEVLDPASPRFMSFFSDADGLLPGCAGSSITDSPGNRVILAFRAMFGQFSRLGPDGCRSENKRDDALLTRDDFEDWRWVEVREPADGEATDRFIDLVRFRGADEMVLHTPRVGFMTTPAFFAVWPTNEDNQARVTLNQTLIGAFGESIDSSQTLFPVVEDALDGEHADPSTTCWGCHRTLDPMRQFFRRSYTYAYSEQRDEEVWEVGAEFAWEGVRAGGDDIYDLAETIGAHDRIAEAWTQKLCFYANSGACPEGEELDRVVGAFATDLDLRVLLRELFSSPLVTGAECVEGGQGDNASIARSRHFCATLSNRLGVSDVCGLEFYFRDEQPSLARQNESIATTVPDDTFSRGDEDPLTIADVNLFITASYERICTNVADDLVDGADDALFDSRAEVDPHLQTLVEDLMGMPASDPRHDEAIAILREHYDDALNLDSVNERAALRSTLTLACISPSVTGTGL